MHELLNNGMVVVACELGGVVVAMAALRFRTGTAKKRQREGERARVSERGGFTSLISPCWPDQPGRRRHAAATRRPRPVASRPRHALPQPVSDRQQTTDSMT